MGSPKDNSFLKRESVGKLLFTMALPMIIGMTVNSLYNIIDSIYVSRLGTDAVTALSIIFPLQNLTVAVFVGLGIGISSVVSRLMGAERHTQAERAASNGMFLACVHALVFIVIGSFLIDFYVSLYSQAGSTIYKWSVDYGQIVLCFSLPYLLYLVFEKLFQSIGWMKTAMIAMMSGAITNIILDPILIFGYFGITPMGVSGAAIATVLGQLVSFIFFFLVYKYSSFPIRIHLKMMRPNLDLISDIYTVAIPSALTLGLPSILVGILNVILVSLSKMAVAVLGLYYKIQTFFYLPTSGLIQGMRPIVSYNYGAKEYTRVQKTIFVSNLASSVILLIGTLILLIFPGEIMNLFAPEEGLRAMAIPALRIISLGFIPSSFSIVYGGAFEAFGLGLDSLIVSVLRQIVFMLPLAYLLGQTFGVIGVWTAFPVSEVLTAVIAFILLRRAYRKLHITNIGGQTWIF